MSGNLVVLSLYVCICMSGNLVALSLSSGNLVDLYMFVCVCMCACYVCVFGNRVVPSCMITSWWWCRVHHCVDVAQQEQQSHVPLSNKQITLNTGLWVPTTVFNIIDTLSNYSRKSHLQTAAPKLIHLLIVFLEMYISVECWTLICCYLCWRV